MKGGHIMARNRDSMEQVVERTKGRIPTAYDLDLEELKRLCEISVDSITEALCMAFDYGFAKGTRAKAKGRVSTL